MSVRSATGGGNAILVMGLTTPFTAPTGIAGITGEATGAGPGSVSYMLFNKNETTTITGDVRIDSVQLEAASKIRNTDWVAFKNHAAVNATITSTTITYEDGSEDKITTVPSSAVDKRLVVAHIDGAVGGKRIVTISTMLLDGASLGSGRAANTLGDTNVKFVSVPAPAQVVIPATFFNPVSNLITPAVVTIPIDSHGTELLM